MSTIQVNQRVIPYHKEAGLRMSRQHLRGCRRQRKVILLRRHSRNHPNQRGLCRQVELCSYRDVGVSHFAFGNFHGVINNAGLVLRKLNRKALFRFFRNKDETVHRQQAQALPQTQMRIGHSHVANVASPRKVSSKAIVISRLLIREVSDIGIYPLKLPSDNLRSLVIAAPMPKAWLRSRISYSLNSQSFESRP